MIITFCGHSDFKDDGACEESLLNFLESKVGEKSAEFYLGGYGEFDSFAYRCCKKYKAAHPRVSLVLITPYMTVEYQRNHLAYQKDKYDDIVYPEIEDKPKKFAISYRNKWMVDKADCVVAYIRHRFGGAYQTYKHAIKQGKVWLNLACIGES